MNPVKQKLFAVANYVQLIISVIILGLTGYGFLYASNELNIWIFLYFLSLLILIVNNCFNLHLMRNYYPDRPLTGRISAAFTVLLILYIMVAVAILVFTGIIFSSVFGSRAASPEDWIGFAIFFTELILGIFILVVQAGLPLLLERNNQAKLYQALDRLGMVDE